MRNFLMTTLNTLLCFTAIGALAGFLFAVVPRSLFKKIKLPFFKFEQEGKFYNQYLKINIWKDHLPQFSKVTKVGFNKSAVGSFTPESLEIFVAETVRAEITHWVLILTSPLYLLFSSYIFPGLNIFLSVFGNLPFIMVQRYNRARISKLCERLQRRKTANAKATL